MKFGIAIGLNAVNPSYYNGWDGELWGCIKDSDNNAVLWAQHGYEVGAMLDSAATREGFRKRIESIAEAAQPGDSVFISHSGHGARKGELLGAYHEYFVLWDGLFSDMEFVALLAKFRTGVRVIVDLDTCHSGGLSRGEPMIHGDGVLRTRYMPRFVSELASTPEHPLITRASITADVVVRSACRPEESAYDTPGGGAFTKACHEARASFEHPPTLAEQWKQIEAWLRRYYPMQHPAFALLGQNAEASWNSPA